jgi:hypothetical protein
MDQARLVWVAFAVSSCMMTPRFSSASVWYVDRDAAGQQTGTSWTDAFVYLEDALQVAGAGDEVRVGQGVYLPAGNPASRAFTFAIPSGVLVAGGFAGFGEPDPNARDPRLFQTILSGDIGMEGDFTDNLFHVVTANGTGPGTVLDGFIIEKGQADDIYPDDRGAAILLNPGDLVCRDCVVRDHYAQSGGAVFVGFGSLSRIEHCEFAQNRVLASGAGLFNLGSELEVVDTLFDRNVAELSGGAVADLYSSSLYENCTFVENLAMYKGGGVYLLSSGPTFRSCRFEGNSVVGAGSSVRGGGGIYAEGGMPLVVQCVFFDNSSSRQGGAFGGRDDISEIVSSLFVENFSVLDGAGAYSLGGQLTLSNCAVRGNLSLSRGGGVLMDDGLLTLIASTITSNRNFGNGGAGVYLLAGAGVVNGCILWDNRDLSGSTEEAQLTEWSGDLSIDYSCVQGWSGMFGGAGNMGAPPEFVDLAGLDGLLGTMDDDVALAPDSPCADAGDEDFDQGEFPVDLNGDPRVVCEIVDMGALEFARIPGDTDCDHVVSLADFLPWPFCAAGPDMDATVDESTCEILDLDLDEDVDLRDFAALTNSFSPPR